jgi:hypothetical protein
MDSSRAAFSRKRLYMTARFRVAGEIRQVDDVSGGGPWNKQGTIVFATGGTPQALSTLNAVRNEHARLWPEFLPGGNHVIFFAAS